MNKDINKSDSDIAQTTTGTNAGPVDANEQSVQTSRISNSGYKQPNIPAPLLSPYDPTTSEVAVIDIHEKSDLANPDTCIKLGLTSEAAEHFSIVLPPPNVTGTLHLGHGLMATLQDISIRFERMRGKRALWIPGTDHAAIATQSKVEKEISKKEGKSRYDLGREELLRRVEEYAQASHDTIVSQTKRMGTSLDWSRDDLAEVNTGREDCFTILQRNQLVGTDHRKARRLKAILRFPHDVKIILALTKFDWISKQNEDRSVA